ncbi:unnamed protein product [Callosobruchus maculatus]|uniref:Mutator-like transposase domain-containing protein n=1 Tax=Callosobruchus maculatus TaxID=64391 RepID=A0A653BD90_CALMS|nr:unnamed protein product [Callosobruchus maculatus]
MTSKQSERVHFQSKNNNAVAWGTVSTGVGYSQYEELMAVLGIPAMAPRTFRKETYKLDNIWQDYMQEDMQENGKREKEIALDTGYTMPDRTQYIAVIVDGGWSKRRNYNTCRNEETCFSWSYDAEKARLFQKL